MEEQSKQAVVLVSMPWDALRIPSIQVGTLKAVLERAAIPTGTRAYNLDFMEHLLHAMPDGFTVDDYAAVTERYFHVGMGDWIFAVPPFRTIEEEQDRAYFDLLAKEAVPSDKIAKARAARDAVPSFLESCANDLVASGARIIGFSSLFSQNVASLALARVLKLRNPSLVTVFGGANCDGPMGAALFESFPWVDIVVRGEAERVFPEVVRDLVAGEPMRPQPGLCFREGGRQTIVDFGAHTLVPMDEVPCPNYDDYFERLEGMSFHEDVKPQLVLLFESARGCWWGEKAHCTFCGLNGSTMTFRSKSSDLVFDEIMALSRRHQRLNFHAVDNIIEMGYFRDLIPRLRDVGCDISIFFETKSNLKKAQIRMLQEAGIKHIQPGIESLSTPILKLMRKGVTALQNIRLLKWCAQYGVRPLWNVIYGFPGEPEDEYDRMADLVPSLIHFAKPNLSLLSLERFSPYHQKPHEFGIEITAPSKHYQLIYPVPPEALDGLAYRFEYRYLDGRNPRSYARRLAEALQVWSDDGGQSSLTYRCGPDFISIWDHRKTTAHEVYTLDETEARIYAACDAGATPASVRKHLEATGIPDLGEGEIAEFLDEMVSARLVYREGDRYLSLAIPEKVDAAERWRPASEDEPAEVRELMQLRRRATTG